MEIDCGSDLRLLPLSVRRGRVSIDETVDSLDPQQRKSVLLVARGAFGKLNVKVVPPLR